MQRKRPSIIIALSIVGLIAIVMLSAIGGRAFSTVVAQSESPGGHPRVQASASVPGPMPSVRSDVPQEDALETLQNLIARWSAAILRPEGGWLHMMTHHTRYKDQAGSLPNGQAIPLNYISDTWYHLNDQGQAVEVIALMRSEDGRTIQAATFRDNVWRNLTVGEKWEGEPFSPRLDLGFSTDAIQALQLGTPLIQEMVTLEGRKALRFTIKEQFASPLSMEGYAQSAIGAERRAYFDAQSGSLLLYERCLVFSDGKERLVEKVVPIIYEFDVKPPIEVLALLQQEVKK